MKRETKIYLENSLYDLIYLLEFKNNAKYDNIYNKYIQQILEKVYEMEENNVD